MNKFALIILLALFSNGCENNLSDADKKRVTELNEKAVQSLMIADFEEAKANYLKALEIDKSDSFIRYELIGIYIEQDSLDKALSTLNKVPSDQKKTTYYYQVKAELLEYKGQEEKAITNYKKALELTEIPTVNNELDLVPIVNYAMLETFSGNREQAVDRLNKLLAITVGNN
jgi:tetratricopeptide (TPR) repeat protein